MTAGPGEGPEGDNVKETAEDRNQLCHVVLQGSTIENGEGGGGIVTTKDFIETRLVRPAANSPS